MKGFLLIDKESGMTSFDVIRDLRRISGVKKFGHAGTLDPLATGLLVIAMGEATKLLEFLIGCDKTYEVVAQFGAVSDSFDADGEITKQELPDINEEEVVAAIEAGFLGNIEQIPPKYSALKVGGKRASDIMREGGDVEMKARKIKIDAYEVVEFNWPEVKFRIECTTGTYVRSLVHDLGQALGCGAYVQELRRTRVGDFAIEKAVKLGELDKKFEQNVLSLESVAKNYDSWDLTDEEVAGLSDGKVLMTKKIEQEAIVMAFHKEKLVGVLESHGGGVKFKKVVLNS